MINTTALLRIVAKNIVYRGVTGDSPTYGWYYASHLNLANVCQDQIIFEHANGTSFSFNIRGDIVVLTTNLPVAADTQFYLELSPKQVIKLTSQSMQVTSADACYSAILDFLDDHEQGDKVIQFNSSSGPIRIATSQVVVQENEQPFNFQSAACSRMEESEWFGPDGEPFILRFHFTQCPKETDNDTIQLEVRFDSCIAESFGLFVTFEDSCIEWHECAGLEAPLEKDRPNISRIEVHASSHNYFIATKSIPRPNLKKVRVYVVSSLRERN